MSIILKKINKKSYDIVKAKKLYIKSFPAKERAPFFLISAKSDKKDVDFWGIYDDSKWVGFMYVINYMKISYIFYFAIVESARGKGYGSFAIKEVLKKYKGKRIFLSIEPIDKKASNYPQRVKRKQFYLKNGFEQLGLKLQEGSMIYELLGVGGKVTPNEYHRLISNYMGKFLSRIVVMKILESPAKKIK